MIDALVSGESIPVLERLIGFTAQRHRLIVGNIANLDTPGYIMQDLPLAEFRAALQSAIQQRRRDPSGPLPATDPRLLRSTADPSNYILFHDRNNRSVEKQMALLAENAMIHNVGIEILKKQFNLLEAAIRERP